MSDRRCGEHRISYAAGDPMGCPACYGASTERDWFAQLLKDRVCFDNLGFGWCQHRECYGNLELLALITAGNATKITGPTLPKLQGTTSSNSEGDIPEEGRK